MIRTTVLGLLMSAVLAIASSPSLAQVPARHYADQLEADWYGNGIHQYFDGRFADAIISFSTAISVNPNDPRPYYYRGLAKLNCNNAMAAAADFRQGAFREAYLGGFTSSSVNQSLERIQGGCRLEIERHRREARLAYQFRNGMPATNPPPVIFGDMVDVDSIVPIIQQAMPPANAAAPGPTTKPPMVQPSEDVGHPSPEQPESRPAIDAPKPDVGQLFHPTSLTSPVEI